MPLKPPISTHGATINFTAAGSIEKSLSFTSQMKIVSQTGFFLFLLLRVESRVYQFYFNTLLRFQKLQKGLFLRVYQSIFNMQQSTSLHRLLWEKRISILTLKTFKPCNYNNMGFWSKSALSSVSASLLSTGAYTDDSAIFQER